MLGLSITVPPPEPAAVERRSVGSALASAGSRAWGAVGGLVSGLRSRGAGETSYTDMIVNAIMAEARGDLVGSRPASVEVASRLVGRAMMAAEVTGAPALTPTVLQTIGRQLILRGESLHAVYRVGGRGADVLLPAGTWDIEGGPLPSSWRYRVDMLGPSDQWTQELIPYDGVLHVVIDPRPDQPWRGTAASSSDAARLAEAAAGSMFGELKTPTAHIIPMPDGVKKPDQAALKADIKRARGNVALPPTTAAGHGDGRVAAPAQDWQPRRLGPEPAAGQVAAQSDVEGRLAAAMGVHPAMLAGDATSGAMREARRQFQVDVLEPYARAVEESARRVWGAKVSIRFPIRSDVVLVMARAAQVLQQMGYAKDKALEMAGWR